LDLRDNRPDLSRGIGRDLIHELDIEQHPLAQKLPQFLPSGLDRLRTKPFTSDEEDFECIVSILNEFELTDAGNVTQVVRDNKGRDDPSIRNPYEIVRSPLSPGRASRPYAQKVSRIPPLDEKRISLRTLSTERPDTSGSPSGHLREPGSQSPSPLPQGDKAFDGSPRRPPEKIPCP
jgi:hypothetical protein